MKDGRKDLSLPLTDDDRSLWDVRLVLEEDWGRRGGIVNVSRVTGFQADLYYPVSGNI